MAIQVIASSAEAALADAGQPSQPIGPAPKLLGAEFALTGLSAEAGIWECGPGRFRRQVSQPEVMHLLKGRCIFEPDGQAPVELSAGDSLFFPAHTDGTWTILEPVRKLYVIL